MKRLISGLLLAAGLLLFAGCNMFPSATATGTSNSGAVDLQSLYANALSAAATVLQNQGVQQAALAAAQAYVHQNVTDENQANLYNQALAAAIPALANAVGTMAQNTGAKNVRIEDTLAFKTIVADTVARYENSRAKK